MQIIAVFPLLSGGALFQSTIQSLQVFAGLVCTGQFKQFFQRPITIEKFQFERVFFWAFELADGVQVKSVQQGKRFFAFGKDELHAVGHRAERQTGKSGDGGLLELLCLRGIIERFDVFENIRALQQLGGGVVRKQRRIAGFDCGLAPIAQFLKPVAEQFFFCFDSISSFKFFRKNFPPSVLAPSVRLVAGRRRIRRSLSAESEIPLCVSQLLLKVWSSKELPFFCHFPLTAIRWMAGKRTKTLCFEKVLSLSPQKRKKVARERATFEKIFLEFLKVWRNSQICF
nr:MAG TPA: hypothetical protein [Caudoviricetes sp.]